MKNKILIWTMGKVGSSTIYQSLLKSKELSAKYDIHHIHWLNKKNIERVVNSYLTANLKPALHLEVSKKIISEVDFENPEELVIITSLRQILPVYISGFFQEINRFIKYEPQLINTDNTLNIDEIISVIIKNIYSKDKKMHYPEFWLRTEIEEVLNIDLFSIPFDYKYKYSIIQKGGIKLLLLRLEDLNSTLLNGLEDLFENKYSLKIINANLSDNKSYKDEYKITEYLLRYNTDIVTLLNRTKYMKHFYKDYLPNP